MPSYKNRKCYITFSGVQYIDYKDHGLLKRFTTKYSKIVPRYYSGTTLRNQKKVARAIKNARFMGLIPFTK